MKKRKILLLLFALFQWASLQATHLLGADLVWEVVGKDSFKITVNFYVDCNGTTPNATSILVKSTYGIDTIKPKLVGGTDITPICDDQCSRCDSSGCSFQYGIEHYQLIGIVDVSAHRKNSACELTFSWSQYGRPWPYTGNNFYLEGKTNICLQQAENSPQFRNPPKSIICLGRDATIDYGCVDSDVDSNGNQLDSLVYSCTDPKTSANGNLQWNSPYSACKPIYYLGFPRTGLSLPSGIHLNSTTGILRFRPMKVEQSTFAMKVESYRNDTLRSAITRDMVITSIKCPNNNPPVLSGMNCKKAQFKDVKLISCTNTSISFQVCTSDPQTDDTTYIEVITKPPGSSFKILDSSARLKKGEFKWEPKAGKVIPGTYQLVLNAHDDACPTPGFNTKVYTIEIIPTDSLKLSYSIDSTDACGSFRFHLEPDSGANISSYHSEIETDNQLLSEDSFFLHRFDTNGFYPILSIVQTKNCEYKLRDTINVNYIHPIESAVTLTEQLCFKDEIKAAISAKGGQSPYAYQWTAGDTNAHNSKTDSQHISLSYANVGSTFEEVITYTVTDSNGCDFNFIDSLTVYEKRLEETDQLGIFCYDDRDSILLKGKGEWYGKGLRKNLLYLDKLKSGLFRYDYSLLDSNTCYFDTALLYIPVPQQLSGMNDTSSCTSADSMLLAANPSGGEWQGKGIAFSDYFHPNLAGKGVHHLGYSVEDVYGCTSSDSMKVEVFDYIPSISLTYDSLKCTNDSLLKLNASPKGGNWRGPGFLGNSSTAYVMIHRGLKGRQEYVFKYRDSNQCKNSDTARVHFRNSPIAAASLITDSIMAGDSLAYRNFSQFAQNARFYWWVGPMADSTGEMSHAFILDSIGYFPVSLIAINQNGFCPDSLMNFDSIRVLQSISIRQVENQEFQLYPNPLVNQFSIRSEKGLLLIYDLNGRQVFRKAKGDGVSIFSPELAAGLYSFRFIGSNGAHFGKMIIRK